MFVCWVCTSLYVRTCVRARMCACACTCVCVCVYVCIHARDTSAQESDRRVAYLADRRRRVDRSIGRSFVQIVRAARARNKRANTHIRGDREARKPRDEGEQTTEKGNREKKQEKTAKLDHPCFPYRVTRTRVLEDLGESVVDRDRALRERSTYIIWGPCLPRRRFISRSDRIVSLLDFALSNLSTTVT